MVAQADPLWDSAIATAALACDVVVAKFSKEVSISADGVSVGLDQLCEKYRELAQSLRDTYDRTAGVGAQPIVFGISTLDFPDFDVRPPSFGKGFTDNPRAGQQDFGTAEFATIESEIPESGFWTGP